jgi:hypothetical protein
MKKKIFSILFCTVLIATVTPTLGSLNKSAITPMEKNSNIQPCEQVNWIEKQKLLASDGSPGDEFGCSVSLSGDNVLIGAVLDNEIGSAYVFTRTGTTWSQQAKLIVSDGEPGGYFGCSVSLDGDTALIGAPRDDDNGYDSGSAYVFIRTGTTWTQQAKLLATDGAYWDHFGISVSLDGDTALIGAPDDNDNGQESGSAYVFTRNGIIWTQQTKLLASDGEAGDYFGCSVSLDGDIALIGAPRDDDNGPMSGSVYVYTRSDTTWSQQAKLITSDWLNYLFGYSVSLDDDTALIGAPGYDNGRGSAYVFTRIGTTWTQQTKLLATDDEVGDQFGFSVSLDGDTSIIGAAYNDDNGEDSGSAYVFTRINTTWSQQAKLLASDGAAVDEFGFSVSLDGDTAMIGAEQDDENGDFSGSVYVFIREEENQNAFIFGRITNLSSQGEYIQFEAVKTRVFTLKPLSFNTYLSGEKFSVSKEYKGFIGVRYIFALCKMFI